MFPSTKQSRGKQMGRSYIQHGIKGLGSPYRWDSHVWGTSYKNDIELKNLCIPKNIALVKKHKIWSHG